MNLQYGTEKETKTLDQDGSTETLEKHIRDFKAVLPMRKHYIIRIRVKTKQDELTEYLKFSDSLNDTKQDPEFRIKHTKFGKENGFYYVEKCWTEVVV